jgi:hypothetical protein
MASHRHATLGDAMRVTITCEECGHKHRLERRISEPGPIWIICHNCELPLQAVLEGPTAARQAETAFAVWKDIFKLSDVGSAS